MAKRTSHLTKLDQILVREKKNREKRERIREDEREAPPSL